MTNICETCKIPLNKPYQSVNYSVNNMKSYLKKHNFDHIYEDAVKTLNNNKLSNYNSYNYIMIDIGKQYANRYIVWFTSKTNNNVLEIPNHIDAYKSYNMGLVKLNKEGFAKFNLPINTIYSEKGVTYATHLHYLVSKKNYKVEEPFLNRFFTKNILPKYNLTQFKNIIKKKNMVCLNSLRLYSADIPNTYYLPTNIAKDYSKIQLDNYMVYVLSNYPPIQKEILNKNITLKETPIMIFCYNSKCNAAKRLAEILYRNGYTNLHYFPGGYLDYYGKQKGGKRWSKNRKRSINCKKPRGFSQKQHCKYGRKKKTKRKN